MKDIFILSIIQGITEFIPVSSTAHLQLAHRLFSLPSLGRLTEVMLHFGTVLVPLIYFHKDIINMIGGVLNAVRGKVTDGFWLAFFIVVATIPVVIAGFTLETYLPSLGRTMKIIGWTSIISGVLLYVIDENAPTSKNLSAMTFKDALVVGMLQVIALIPGVSRLGITLIATRILGFKRTEAARFSFLLSIPAILGAATLMVAKLPDPLVMFTSTTLLTAMAISFGVGLIVLFMIMTWLKKFSFAPIALYRIALGLFLLWYF